MKRTLYSFLTIAVLVSPGASGRAEGPVALLFRGAELQHDPILGEESLVLRFEQKESSQMASENFVYGDASKEQIQASLGEVRGTVLPDFRIALDTSRVCEYPIHSGEDPKIFQPEVETYGGCDAVRCGPRTVEEIKAVCETAHKGTFRRLNEQEVACFYLTRPYIHGELKSPQSIVNVLVTLDAGGRRWRSFLRLGEGSVRGPLDSYGYIEWTENLSAQTDCPDAGKMPYVSYGPWFGEESRWFFTSREGYDKYRSSRALDEWNRCIHGARNAGEAIRCESSLQRLSTLALQTVTEEGRTTSDQRSMSSLNQRRSFESAYYSVPVDIEMPPRTYRLVLSTSWLGMPSPKGACKPNEVQDNGTCRRATTIVFVPLGFYGNQYADFIQRVRDALIMPAFPSDSFLSVSPLKECRSPEQSVRIHYLEPSSCPATRELEDCLEGNTARMCYAPGKGPGGQTIDSCFQAARQCIRANGLAHYYDLFGAIPSIDGIGACAYQPGDGFVGDARAMSHEWGHNLALNHLQETASACDFQRGPISSRWGNYPDSLLPPETQCADIMSYCHPSSEPRCSPLPGGSKIFLPGGYSFMSRGLASLEWCR